MPAILITGCSSGFGLETGRLFRERDEHPTFPFAIAAARTAPSPIGAERDGRRSR